MLAKARAVALSLCEPGKGKQVKVPKVLRREKPNPAARSQKGADSLSSLAERTLKRSTAEFCMLKSPATR